MISSLIHLKDENNVSCCYQKIYSVLSLLALSSIICSTLLLIQSEKSREVRYYHTNYNTIFFKGALSRGMNTNSTNSVTTSRNFDTNSTNDNLHATTESHSNSTVLSRNFDTKYSTDNKLVTASPLSWQTSCEVPHCAQFLSKEDEIRLKECTKTVYEKVRGFEELLSTMVENDCNFMNGTGRDPVALVSPPGSGNTWVRGLLEKATGFCTGYGICDYTMRLRGFIGENINSGTVLVVKVHNVVPQWVGGRVVDPARANFSSAVVLLRNPYDSLVAEWNRKLAGKSANETPYNYYSHTNVASKDIWCEYSGTSE